MRKIFGHARVQSLFFHMLNFVEVARTEVGPGRI